MKNWLFLRGDWDENNKRNVKNETDMWCQLFVRVAYDDVGNIYYKGKSLVVTQPINRWSPNVDFKKVTHVFSRGGHEWQVKVVKKCKKAYKIYYGAGLRYIPKDGIKYDLVLADSEQQLRKLRKKGFKAELWFKPAAKHFKPMDVKKKYDCCFVAIHPTDERKNLKWVYKTVPKDLKILQLGNTPKFKVPKNVTVKKVTLDKMPKYMNQCRVLIAPYTKDDSSPRVLSEALACGLPVVCLDSVRFWKEKYTCAVCNKYDYWNYTKFWILMNDKKQISIVSRFYKENLSMQHAVTHLKGLIDGN